MRAPRRRHDEAAPFEQALCGETLHKPVAVDERMDDAKERHDRRDRQKLVVHAREAPQAVLLDEAGVLDHQLRHPMRPGDGGRALRVVEGIEHDRVPQGCEVAAAEIAGQLRRARRRQIAIEGLVEFPGIGERGQKVGVAPCAQVFENAPAPLLETAVGGVIPR